MKALIFLSFVTITVFTACSGDEGASALLPAVEDRQASPALELEGRSAPTKKSGTATVPLAHPMLPYSIDGRLLPEDFEIGLLQDQLERTRDEAAIVDRISRLLGGLSEGEVSDSSFTVAKRYLMTASLGYYVENGLTPDGFRLGRIEHESATESWVAVRLFGRPGRSSGVVYLKEHDGTWLISDLQLDLQNLADEYHGAEGKFYPSHYRDVLRYF